MDWTGGLVCYYHWHLSKLNNDKHAVYMWTCLPAARVLQLQNMAFCMVSTAVCVDLAKCEPKRCAHEYNYVVWLPIQPVKEVYHIIIFMCTAFLVHILQAAVSKTTMLRREDLR